MNKSAATLFLLLTTNVVVPVGAATAQQTTQQTTQQTSQQTTQQSTPHPSQMQAAVVKHDEPASESSGTKKAAEDGKVHHFMPNHPRWRRITKAAAFGVATGGILGPILGVGVIGGAAAGAAEHSAVRAAKDQHDAKKKGHLDHHIW